MSDESKVHHLYGGSTAKYWSNCYGWAALVSTLPSQPAGQAAIKGTALHTGVLERKAIAEIEYLRTGKKTEVKYDDIPAWPLEGEELANQFWQAMWVNVLEEFLTGKVVYIEKKLMFSEEQDSGGTADVVVLYHNDKGKLVGVIGDLKTGYHRVEPSEEQLLFYLAALYLRFKEKSGKEVEEFKSFIYQPSHSEPYTEHTFSKATVMKAIKKYEKAILESKKPKPKFKTGDWCKWCRAQAVCKAYSDHLGKQMDLAVAESKLPAVEHLPDETLRNIFMYGDQIENYISSVRKHIIHRFTVGEPIEGLKVIAGVSKRRWKDEVTAEITLKDAGINPMTEKLLGITAVEAMLKNTGLSKEQIAYTMSTITEKPAPAPKVVSADDPRPAIELSRENLLLGMDDEVEF